MRAVVPDRAIVFGSDDEARNAYLKGIGVENIDPPLMSPFLKIKSTGRVLPWNELLAEQTTLVENCDAYGNTDPEAWQHLVLPDDTLSVSQEDTRNLVLKQAAEMTGSFRSQDAVDISARPANMPYGAMSWNDVSTSQVEKQVPPETSLALDKIMEEL